MSVATVDSVLRTLRTEAEEEVGDSKSVIATKKKKKKKKKGENLHEWKGGQARILRLRTLSTYVN